MTYLHVKARFVGGATQVFQPVLLEADLYKAHGITAAFAAHAALNATEDESFEQVLEHVGEMLAVGGIVVLMFKDTNGDDVYVNLAEVGSWTCRMTEDEEPVFRAASPKAPFA